MNKFLLLLDEIGADFGDGSARKRAKHANEIEFIAKMCIINLWGGPRSIHAES